MTLQWTIVTGFMYAEMGLVLLLLLPFISPKRWQSVFRSRLMNWLGAYFSIYYKFMILALIILAADAFRTSHKYDNHDKVLEQSANPHAADHMHFETFRAQRNLYITLFTLLLWLILARLVRLISSQAQQMASNEAALRQAKSASDAAMQLMSQAEKKASAGSSSTTVDAAGERSKLAKELADSKDQLSDAKKDLKKAQVDLETMKKQSKQNDQEYDRLMKEHEKLQMRLSELECQDGSKKSS